MDREFSSEAIQGAAQPRPALSRNTDFSGQPYNTFSQMPQPPMNMCQRLNDFTRSLFDSLRRTIGKRIQRSLEGFGASASSHNAVCGRTERDCDVAVPRTGSDTAGDDVAFREQFDEIQKLTGDNSGSLPGRACNAPSFASMRGFVGIVMALWRWFDESEELASGNSENLPQRTCYACCPASNREVENVDLAFQWQYEEIDKLASKKSRTLPRRACHARSPAFKIEAENIAAIVKEDGLECGSAVMDTDTYIQPERSKMEYQTISECMTVVHQAFLSPSFTSRDIDDLLATVKECVGEKAGLKHENMPIETQIKAVEEDLGRLCERIHEIESQLAGGIEKLRRLNPEMDRWCDRNVEHRDERDRYQ